MKYNTSGEEKNMLLELLVIYITVNNSLFQNDLLTAMNRYTLTYNLKLTCNIHAQFFYCLLLSMISNTININNIYIMVNNILFQNDLLTIIYRYTLSNNVSEV